MTIDELLQVYRRYHDKVGCAGDECYVCAAQEAYEQAKKPMGGDKLSPPSPATALVQKLVDACKASKGYFDLQVYDRYADGCAEKCQQAITEAQAYLKQQEGKASEVVGAAPAPNWLLSSAQALLDLDASGSLSPHGIGNHAHGIIQEFIRVHCNVERIFNEAIANQQPAQQGKRAEGEV